MSISNNKDLSNPAVRFYRWNGSDGGFNYWDKSAEKKVDVPLPFRFIVMDSLATIKGYSDEKQSGFWSNEVRKIGEDSLTVRTKNGIAAKGLYQSIRANPACKGATFCQSVYIAFKESDGSFVIANIQFMGAALSAWIEFRKKNRNVYAGAVEISEMQDGQKGAVKYKIPVFKMTPVSEQSIGIAKDLDGELQNYLDSYFGRSQEEKAAVHDVEETVKTDEMQDVPITDINGQPIDDLPF